MFLDDLILNLMRARSPSWHDAPHKHDQYTHKIFSFVLKYKYFDKILKYYEQLWFIYSLEKQIWQSLARIKSVYGVHMYWQPQSQLVRSNRAYACQNYQLYNHCVFNKISSHRYNFGNNKEENMYKTYKQ